MERHSVTVVFREPVQAAGVRSSLLHFRGVAHKRRSSLPIIFVAIIVAGILAIGLFFSGLSAIGLTGPDEPRYAWIARAMAFTGDWITPKLYGHPWFEKPALYYWSAAIGFKFLRSPEWAARLPSAVAALIAACTMVALGFWRYGARTALAVLLIFPTCVGVIAFSRAAGPDMLFTAALALAMFSAASIAEKYDAFPADPLRRRPSDRLELTLLGAWLGVATLAKGPAAVVLAGGSVLLWAIATRKLKIAIRMVHPLAILSFAIVALPWYVLCARANPDFFRVFIVEHNFQRYLTPMFQHPQPFWFFVAVILLGTLPWTAFLIGAAFDGVRIFRDGSWRSSAGLFIACWAIFPTIFFSFSQSKLPEYILPAFPALALLMAQSFVCAMEHAPRKAQWMGVVTGTMWVVLGVAGAIGFHRLPMYTALDREQIASLAMSCLLIGVAVGALIEVVSLWRKLWLVIALSALACAGLVFLAEARVLPELDALLSTRPMARDIIAIAPGAPIYSLGDVNRDCTYGLQFYLQRDSLPEFNPKIPGEHYVLMTWGGDMKLNDMGVLHRKIVARFLPYCWIESIGTESAPPKSSP